MSKTTSDGDSVGRKKLIHEGSVDKELLGRTSDIVVSYVSNNNINPADLPALIKSVYTALVEGIEGRGTEERRLQPAVPIRKSITPEYIICLEDGKKLKMLKRHLKSSYGLTPDEYREKWGLSHDYPMVAPNYAKKRSKLAKDIGLGTKSVGGEE